MREQPQAERVHLWDELGALRRELKFRSVLLHLFADPTFYEPIGRYSSTREYADLVRTALPRWRSSRSGVWTYMQPPSPIEIPVQGWKIHVSTVPPQARDVLGATAETCLHADAPFKYLADESLLILMNDKLVDRGAAGKFITVYPRDDEQCAELLERLRTTLAGCDGPLILSDRRYRDSHVVHYRYGGVRSFSQLDEEGQLIPLLVGRDGHGFPDLRMPYFTLPPGVSDPFGDEQPDEVDSESLTLNNGRYVVQNAMSFTNAGGVYEAIDTTTGEAVVIKEARPGTVTNRLGLDAVALRQKEWRILNRLADTGIVPRPIELFWDWEHLFLVESRVDGVTARRFASARATHLRQGVGEEELDNYFRSVVTIVTNLARALDALHERGIIFGDVSPNNIIVLPDQSVVLVDLEGAYEAEVGVTHQLFTNGFTSSKVFTRDHLSFVDDYYAVGCVMLWLIIPINAILDVKPDAPAIFLDFLRSDYGLPTELRDTILALMDASEERRPSLRAIVESLPQASIRSHRPPERIDLDVEVFEKAVSETARFIEANARPKRRDHLFPTDPNSPNPLNFAHGALGTALALRRIRGEVPVPVRRWIEAQPLSPDRYPPGLYVGLAGIAWALDELGFADRSRAALDDAYVHELLFRSGDAYVGCAGVGLTSLRFWSSEHDDRLLDRAVAIGDWLIAHRQENERGAHWPTRTGAVLIGYARGAAGIALYLLYLYLATGESRYLEIGRRALEHDLSYAVPVGSAIAFPEDTGSTRVVLPYWYAGGVGLGAVALRYWAVTRDVRYREVFDKVAIDAARTFTVFPGLFNGLSGLGNFLLDCAELTGDARFLEGAVKPAVGVLRFGVARPDGLAFPGDYLYRLSADLAGGTAGVALFLHRLCTRAPNFDLLPDTLIAARPSANDVVAVL